MVVFLVLTCSAFAGGLATLFAVREGFSDAWHPRASQTYRVVVSLPHALRSAPSAMSSRDLGRTITGGSPEIEAATTIVPQEWVVDGANGGPGRPVRVLFVDKHFADLFDVGVTGVQLEEMDAGGAVRLTREAAQDLGLETASAITVEGRRVALHSPLSPRLAASHFDFDVIAPLSLLDEAVDEARLGGSVMIVRSSDAVTYVRIARGADKRASALLASTLLDLTGLESKVILQPVTMIRRDDAPGADGEDAAFVTGRANEFYAAIGLAAIALLAGALSVSLLLRTMIEREAQMYGVLRAVGRTPFMLLKMVAAELAVVAIAAWILAVTLAAVLGSALLEIIGAALAWTALVPAFALASAAMLLLVVAIACSSSWPLLRRPVSQLLSGTSAGSGALGFGLATIGFQAAVCFAAIFSTLFISDQLDQAISDSRQFRDVWRIEVNDPAQALHAATTVRSTPGVDAAVLTGWAPYSDLGSTYLFSPDGARADENFLARTLVAGEDTGELLGQELLAGDRLARGDSGTCRVVVNAGLVRQAGYDGPKDAIGKTFTLATERGSFDCVIKGVVEDTRLRSVREPGRPFIQMNAVVGQEGFYPKYVLFRGSPEAARRATRDIGVPENFMATRLGALEAKAYEREFRFRTILLVGASLVFAAIFATLASAIGLALEEKAVEIGIRRTLGFTWTSIGLHLCRPFAIASVVGAIAALPAVVWAGLAWSRGLLQPVILSPVTFGFAFIAVMAPLLLAMALNWTRLRSISPAAVLRTQ